MNDLEYYIRSNPDFVDFVKGKTGHMDFLINKVPVCIYREDIGVSFYYRLPYNASFDYGGVVDFMKQAIPVISRIVEDERIKNLYGPDCIKP